MLLAATTESVTSVLGPLQLDHNGLSASTIGAILSVGSGVFIVVALVVTRAAGRAMRPGVAVAGLILLAGVAILLASSSGTAVTSVGLVLRTGVLGVLFTVCFPLAGIGADAAGVGRGAVYAALQAAGGLASTVGPLAAGKIGETAGDWVAYSGVAGLCVAAAAWLFTAGRRQRGILPE
jgi:MFS family permease